MKRIGMIGGMSWESTSLYYQRINQAVALRRGGLHSADILLHSVDFHPIEQLQRKGDWEAAGKCLANSAKRLEQAGADFLILCTNTMHKTADAIACDLSIPLLHIADATANAVKQVGVDRVGLLGTRFTMEESFYRGRLETEHELRVDVPDEASRHTVHRIIYEELCQGHIEEGSRSECAAIIDELVSRGCQGVILGCTELSLLVKSHDRIQHMFDTTLIHADAAAEYALEGS